MQKFPKELPSKYFYDDTGSHLFEQISRLEEYYPTRTELDILQARQAEIAELLGPHCLLIEYGSGNSQKTHVVLEALRSPAGYVPIEIAQDALQRAVRELEKSYPDLEVLPVCTDYTGTFTIPTPTGPVVRRVAYFPGSTIGNFDPEPAQNFLKQIAHVCRKGGGLLIGVDLKKDCNLLHAAYNDRQGVTAHFNRHILERINTELAANFQLEQFAHYAFYHPWRSRIEMHLVSLQKQAVQIGAVEIPFKQGESIWTESSYKYTLEEFAQLAAVAGFSVQQVWTDPQEWFSVHYLVVDG